MKKLFISSALIFGLSASNAIADNVEKPFYVGIGYQLSRPSYNQMQDKFNGWGKSVVHNGSYYFDENFANINFFAGYQINQNIAVEAGYFSKNGSQKNHDSIGLTWPNNGHNVATQSKSDLKIINLDTVFSHNLNDKIKLLGIFGLSKISYDKKISYFDGKSFKKSDNKNQNGYGVNLGVGSEFIIVKNLSVRLIAKYSTASSIDSFKYITSYNIGAKYKF